VTGHDDAEPRARTEVVCLIGSTRFREVYEQATLRESLRGRVVLSVACFPERDADGAMVGISPEEKSALDALHLRKVEMADEVLVLNVGGYVGPSTTIELRYARALGKPVRFWETVSGLPERVSALAFREGRVLLVQTELGVAPPGGPVAPGESQAEALRRIVARQTGHRVDHVGPQLSTVDGPDGHDRLYSVTVSGGLTVAGGNASRAWWALPSEIAAGVGDLGQVTGGLRALRERYGAA
jgi:ADP-ribose pyrophosphatase YjhB (NUDIX family)